MSERTIAENLQRLKGATTAIGNAITAKGGTVNEGDGLEEFAADIATIPSGGGGGTSTNKKDVNFYDYDGTIVNSYTAAEFAELTAMPNNPTHDGLTAQGWNWSLTDAKNYVSKYGKLNIGQMYITSDGKTRLYIELTEGRLTPYLNLYLNANSELDIDWGDGSTHSTFTNTGSSGAYSGKIHTYASAGSYIIAITVISGGFVFQAKSSILSTLLTYNNDTSTTSPNLGYLNSIKRIEIGSSVTSIGSYAFKYCHSLTTITIPSSVTSIDTYAFDSCFSLKSITIPDSVIGIGVGAFCICRLLKSITIPNSVTSIGNSTFDRCESLTTITIPNSITGIDNATFEDCELLTTITIPSSVTSIGNAFEYCHSLTTITIPSSVTSIGSNAFAYCYSLATITINRPSGSISGSPWRATTSSPTSTRIVWTG